MVVPERLKRLASRLHSIAKRGKWPLLGVGIGIGCAALLAAALVLLYGGGAKATAMRITGGTVHGERLTLTVTVENGGLLRANYHARLTADGNAACARDIVLKPKEKRSLQMEVTGLPPGVHTLALGDMVQEVRVLRPASFRVTGLTVGPETIQPGESVEAEATVENTGEVAGEYTAVFRLDGARWVVLKETMEPGASRKVKATLEQIPRGSHTVELDGVRRPVAALAPAKVTVSGLELSSLYMQPQETVEAYVYLTNDGDFDGAGSAELFVDGISAGTQEISVEAGGRACCVYKITKAKEGTYTVRAGEFERKLEVLKLSRPGTGTMFVRKANGGECTLKIKNLYNVDVIVTLADKYSQDKAVLSFYLRAGEKNKGIRVKDGTYVVYYTLGTDYSAQHKKFMTVYGYKRSREIEFDTWKTSRWVFDYDYEDGGYYATTVHRKNQDFSIGDYDNPTSIYVYPK